MTGDPGITAPGSDDTVSGPGHLIVSEGWPGGYALLDSGKGRKLERFGAILVDRPEPQALWSPRLSPDAWAKADAVFLGSGEEDGDDLPAPRPAGGLKGKGKGKASRADAAGSPQVAGQAIGTSRWTLKTGIPETWAVSLSAVRFFGRLTPFRHLGYFPEQKPHWDWMGSHLRKTRQPDGQPPLLLNLFGYTGVGSLLAAAAGASVTHVDASKKALTYARENRDLSSMDDAPIRWICEDARGFLARELRRGRRYQGILVDPPKYGRGPKGEVWDLFSDLPALLEDCKAVLDPDHGAMVLTTYAIRASHLALYELSAEVLAPLNGTLQAGELAVRETPDPKQSNPAPGRLLATSH
ncbi:MAG: hypothetical protein ACPGYL_10030, partial [Rhodospirillaceae bacterium]